MASASSGHHVLRIDGFSTTCDVFYGLKCINSCPFRAGGHTWRLRFFPKGGRPEHADCMSLYLALVATAAAAGEPVMAKATFAFLDRDRKPVPSHSRGTRTVDFSERRLRSGYGFHDFITRGEFERLDFLDDGGCLAIRVDVHVLKQQEPPPPASTSVPAPAPEPDDDDTIHRHLSRLLSSGEDADVEFLVGGEKFAAHRLVLRARSSVFKAQLALAPLKNGSVATDPIQIHDTEAPVFGAMLTFIYTDVWPAMADRQGAAAAAAFAITQRLLAAADRYGLQRLKLMCEGRLCDHVDTASVATILALAEKHHCAGLKGACFEFLGTSAALSAAMETAEFEHLTQACPGVMEELVLNVIARDQEKGKSAGWNRDESQTSIIKIPM